MSRVWVVGSINADVILRVPHLPVAGETVHGEQGSGLGGKGANQAVAAARYGAAVSLVGAVGGDERGVELIGRLTAMGVDVSRVRLAEGPSGTAIVTVDSAGENAIVVVEGANGKLGPDAVAALPFGSGDVVVAQGELPLRTTVAALRAARAASALTVWNPAPAVAAQREHLALADVLVVNESELATLTGAAPTDLAPAESSIADGVVALRHAGPPRVVATLGARGLVAADGDDLLRIPARSVDVVDTTGAGDCFVGVLAASLADGEPFAGALETATVAASIAIGRPGAAASMPTAAEVASLRLAP